MLEVDVALAVSPQFRLEVNMTVGEGVTALFGP